MKPASRVGAALALGAASTLARASDADPAPRGDAPIRLAIVVVVDQMGRSQLERLEPWLDGGLGRFARDGLVFCDAALEHGRTETAPGHASIGTGLHPARHGVVANDWIAASGEGSYSFGDPEARPVTAAGVGSGGSASPRNLRASGMADWLRAASPRSKSIAISAKDRSAIGASGRKADVALWWDRARGGFVTSTWYASQLPEWARELDAHWVELVDAAFAGSWRSTLPADFERSGTAPDEREGEVGKRGARSFPHALPAHSDPPTSAEIARLAGFVFVSPAVDFLAAELARRALEREALGADGDVDLLVLSLSACDTVGHMFGPSSCEVSDVILRADRELERLFDLADQRVGRGRWIAALTSDHGVLELPESLEGDGLAAARVPSRRVSEVVRAARADVARHFGFDFFRGSDARGVRLAHDEMRELGCDPAEVRRELARSLEENGGEWIERALTWDELRAIARDGAPADEIARLEARSFDEERTSDVVIVPRSYVLAGTAVGTTHGSPHAYDRAIPLAFLGPGFERDWRSGRAAGVDLAPTLFARLGIAVPAALDGRALVE